jgi:hypothetical protein
VTSRAPVSPGAAPTSTVVAAALVVLLAGCASAYPGSTLAQQVRSWVRVTSFESALSTLRSDAAKVPRAAATHRPALLRTVCDILVDDALGANQNLPTPDARLTAVLSAAYQAAAAGGRDCLAVADGKAPSLTASSAQLDRAESDYVKAEARLDDLGATSAGSS